MVGILVSFWDGLFSGAMLVRFREGNDSPNSPWRFHRKNHKNTPLKIQPWVYTPPKKIRSAWKQGALYYQPKQCTIIREMPQDHH